MPNDVSAIIAALAAQERVTDDALARLLADHTPGLYDATLFRRADSVRRAVFGDAVYIRGLLEISNHCTRDCYYCGIRNSSRPARYRLSLAQILDCCDKAYRLGFRTFVLQAGEDPALRDASVCAMVEAIKARHPDAAVTLSLGERERASYQAFFNAGAERYLLRHETADNAHYARLHPANMSPTRRKECLFALKDIGFQVGSGFLVGAPWQSPHHLVRDIRFLQELDPEMIGIGPFIPHHATPFGGFAGGGLHLTLRLLAVLRLMFPQALIPATTALVSLAENGRALGLFAGANVLMPNISPPEYRHAYSLYDNKRSTGCESAEGLAELYTQVLDAGYTVTVGRGDAPGKGSAHGQYRMA